MKFALAYAALLTLLFGCLREQEATNYGLPLVQSAAPRHGFICTTPLTPNVRPVRKTEAFT